MTRGATDLSRTHLHTPQVESGLGIGRMVGSRFAMAGEQLKAKGMYVFAARRSSVRSAVRKKAIPQDGFFASVRSQAGRNAA